MQSVSIIIPAYNEENAIAHAVKETRDTFLALKNASHIESFEILVINDGSKDGTQNVLTSLTSTIPELVVINHPKNLGKGAAVKTGVAAASNPWMLMLDADLSTHPRAFKDFLPLLAANDVIIGSRRINGAKINAEQPLHRRLAGSLFRTTVRTCLNLPYKDTQCGFKALRAEPLKPIFASLESHGWVFDIELLAKARAKNLRIQEVPIEWSHGRESKVRFTDIFVILKELYKIRRNLQ